MSKEIVYEMSQSESLIMDFLWKRGEKNFAEIMLFLNEEKGKKWKKQTVNTFIKRLSDKGLIETDEKVRNKAYRAAVSRIEYEKGRAKKLLNAFYGGSIHSFLLALTGGKEIDEKFADELREMVEKSFS